MYPVGFCCIDGFVKEATYLEFLLPREFLRGQHESPEKPDACHCLPSRADL